MTPDMANTTYSQHLADVRRSLYDERIKPHRLADPLAFRERELAGLAILKHLHRLWSESPARQGNPICHSPTAAPGASPSGDC